ncbi:CLOCK-interacting pacemaker [Pangasianodon hypophthalmus]|uniref:CLOCK-interacting pacemaker n=1 Tax=Pangasianodon hypophthalmus TaxID=310915 RepID=UPI002306F3DB|nr:CLOCK-interacting pacemaker [Pangasianodon hypophthalmus]XP_053090921.1 CLOCK-interacting pacemaker [Pangasianodon hypophthalmus]
MPQESSCVGRCAALPASKNAKDKSNSASLLSRTKFHTEQVMNGRNSRCSSEKDSGYSDAGSDYQQTDVDDQHSTVTELKGRKPQSTADQGNHILVSGQAEFTPMFIIKNVVLKQSGQTGQDQVLQSLWGTEGTNSQSNLLLLQQPGITVSPLHVLTPQLRRAESKNKKGKNTYLPILNSYPRIAPNLNKKKTEKPPASREGSSEEHSLSKRVCTEEIKEVVSEKHPDKQLESHFLSHSHSFLHSRSSSGDLEQRSSCLPPPELKIMGTSAFTSLSSSSVSTSKTSSPSFPFSSCSEPAAHLLPTSKVSLSGGSVPDSTIGLTRHRRFLNTVEILSQSGLLDITLRTQELLRQSAATEQNIAQLRQHTHLLCQAVHAGSKVPTLEKIHRVMVESGCYPNLRNLLFMGSDDGELEADSNSKIDAMITYRCGFNGQGEVAPPSPLLTIEPGREGRDFPSADQQDSTFGMEWLRAHGKRPPHKKLLVPPDSSTCGVAAVETYTE